MAACLCPLQCHAQITLKPGGNQSGRALSNGPTAEVITPRVKAELVALAPQGVATGQPLWLGLLLTHQPGWHTYWKNPGDSGLPTQLNWQLPGGLTAGDIAWPLPHKIRVGNLTNLGYEGQVLLPVPVSVASNWQSRGAQNIPIRLQASWLVCRQECIPEQADLALDLSVGSSTAGHATEFKKAQAAAPRTLAQIGHAQVTDDGLKLRIEGLPTHWRGQAVSVLPEAAELVDLGAPMQANWDGSVWQAQLPLSPQRDSSPSELAVVLHLESGSEAALRGVLAVQGSWPPVATASKAVPAALSAALAANQTNQTASAAPPGEGSDFSGNRFVWALLGALLGGLILNLMPCVFPVLAIKLLSFSRHAGEHGARHLRAQGLAYTLGVMASFLALGTLMLVLRAGGAQLGWGFQLQSPPVVAALAGLFTLMGLNLAGLFEFGSWLPNKMACAEVRHPVADAALSGVLAVAVASPCTAPFMGASLGLTLALPAWQALSVFAALGLGMALPYFAVAVLPGVSHWISHRLPRPGAWMQTFRQLMAFPMFATVVWLVWVLGQQTGIDGVAVLLALLLALSALMWALALHGRSRLVLGSVFALLLGWLALSFGTNLLHVAEASQLTTREEAQGWQPWSEQRVQALVAEGRPVFVDFTAAWCVTCQVNKRTTLANPALLSDMADRRVALLRADWTRQDPTITTALKALGRSGVPVYVAYLPGQQAVVLSELLSLAEVRQALDLPGL